MNRHQYGQHTWTDIHKDRHTYGQTYKKPSSIWTDIQIKGHRQPICFIVIRILIRIPIKLYKKFIIVLTHISISFIGKNKFYRKQGGFHPLNCGYALR